MSVIDNIINEFDIALKTLSNKKSGTSRSYPAEDSPENLTQEEKDLSIQLMRVNLAGEVAAQALYRGQAMVCEDDEVKEHLINAGLEETDHLIWCKKRLDELGGNGSLLNPIWYAGSFALGAILEAQWFSNKSSTNDVSLKKYLGVKKEREKILSSFGIRREIEIIFIDGDKEIKIKIIR